MNVFTLQFNDLMKGILFLSSSFIFIDLSTPSITEFNMSNSSTSKQKFSKEYNLNLFNKSSFSEIIPTSPFVIN